MNRTWSAGADLASITGSGSLRRWKGLVGTLEGIGRDAGDLLPIAEAPADRSRRSHAPDRSDGIESSSTGAGRL
jgi:hypothetical protein